MEKGRGSDRGKRGTGEHFKSFAELAKHLRQSGEDLELHVYPSLKFGAVWWIPDEMTGFDVATEHPWIVVVPYQQGRPVIVACPRTSQVDRNQGKGLFLPAGAVAGLDRDGIVLVQVRRTLVAADFRYYRHAGYLPEEWQQRLQAELARWAADVAKQSEEP